jgi:SAM-dependent methyltransferase
MLATKKSFFARSETIYVSDIDCSLEESLEYKAILKYAFKYHKKNSSKIYNDILHLVFNCNDITPEYIEFLFDFDVRIKGSYSMWGKYQDDFFRRKLPNERFSRILQLIKEFTPKDAQSFLDIAGNSGYLCSLIAKTTLFQQIVNLDNDEVALEKGRELLQGAGVDFFRISFAELKRSGITSDVTVASALTHHLILDYGYNVFDVIGQIAKITNKIAFIEFMPLGLYGGGGTLPPLPDFYTEEYFELNFKEHFVLLHKEVVGYEKVNGDDLPHRVLFVGAKK